ncbi:MAG: hypothetical protein KDB53_18070, partial [Planctomycetes bacterium]|nr:hypothetical protein [Planctomycetota bacterium]
MSRSRPTLRISTAVTVITVALVLLPIILTLWSAFTGDVSARWDHLNGVVYDRMVNTLVLASVATILALVIALPLVYTLHRCEFFGRRLLGLLYVAPLLIPPHIHAISWLRIFGNKGYIT